MKVASLALLAFALLVALTWPPATAEGAAPAAAEPEVCQQLTAERILSAPELAAGWDHAVRSNDPSEIARMHALAGEIRAAHGCDAAADDGDAPAGDPAAALPPGHPPIHAPALPPGHPRIPATPGGALFDEPVLLTI